MFYLFLLYVLIKFAALLWRAMLFRRASEMPDAEMRRTMLRFFQFRADCRLMAAKLLRFAGFSSLAAYYEFIGLLSLQRVEVFSQAKDTPPKAPKIDPEAEAVHYEQRIIRLGKGGDDA